MISDCFIVAPHNKGNTSHMAPVWPVNRPAVCESTAASVLLDGNGSNVIRKKLRERERREVSGVVGGQRIGPVQQKTPGETKVLS